MPPPVTALALSLLLAMAHAARAGVPGRRLAGGVAASVMGRHHVVMGRRSLQSGMPSKWSAAFAHKRGCRSGATFAACPRAAAFSSLPSAASFPSKLEHQQPLHTQTQNIRTAPLSILASSSYPSTALRVSKNKDIVSGAAYHASINQQLVRRRNEASKQKREARQRALDSDRERNLKLRELFLEEHQADRGGKEGGDGGQKGAHRAPPMFAVKVVTCPTLRAELKMNGREKRGRMFVERPPFFSDADSSHGQAEEDGGTEEYACTSLKALRKTIHEFFRRLKKSTFILSASLPTLDEEGNVLTHADDMPMEGDNSTGMLGTWSLEADEDVQRAFQEAEDFFLRHREHNQTSALKRPTMVLHVTKDPNAPPPPPPPPYLEGMPDPLASPTMTMLSFYAFPPNAVDDPEATAETLRKLWRPFRALGRVYVAREGVNAQMGVPTNVLSQFLECCTLSEAEGGALSDVLGTYMENGINIDPIPVDMNEFNADPPFKNLHVRVRSQIVADGFETPLDWQNAGHDMPPMEWHQKLKEARERQLRATEEGTEDANELPIVLDCRNDYETQVGKFELAEPLETESFRESWDVLKERLKDVPKDAPIMTYCTGGIRCVKVNAYLTQELEFTNVSRLAGGVIGYDRTLNEKAPVEEPMFKGVNYVFDGRMGRRITDDQLGTCHTCGRKTHLVTNCKNDNCHRRMVQCEFCSDSLFGTCSEGCKGRVYSQLASKSDPSLDTATGGTFFSSTPDQEAKDDSESTDYSTLDDYSAAHSTEPAPLLREIEENTAHFLPSGAHMVSGATQGSLLTILASMTRTGRVLEIGTFTGYATACFLEGAAAVGRCLCVGEIGSRDAPGPFVLSLERDRRALGVASAHIQAMAGFGVGAEGAEEASKLRRDGSEAKDFDGESTSFSYDNAAGCELLRVNDALATVEELALNNPAQLAFDIAFVDADKTRLMEYVDALVSNDRVLKKGGLILVDNTLWKGLVLDASRGYDSDSDDEVSEDKELLRKNRRARKLAAKMHRFNSEVVKDDRVEVLMMNLRDGLSMIRKR
ncbi:hypothetical protein ACHAXT_001969 [Thalassiosira profunda]